MAYNGEIIHVHVGQAGIQIANSLWELYCLEHGINACGCFQDCPLDSSLTAFFASSNFKLVPRLVMVDSEPTVLDEVRNGTYGFLYKPDSLISGKEDSGSNFARGYYNYGTTLLNITMNNIRKLTEACTNVRGFIVFRSIGGGTGSGLGDRIMEHLLDEYNRKTKMDFIIFPSPSLSPLIVEPYNSMLATHLGMDSCDCTFILDNEGLYDICEKKLDVPSPTYTNLNRIIAQSVSSITASMRFYGSKNISFAEIPTNLVPFPRIHFPLVGYSPLAAKRSSAFAKLSTEQISVECFQPSNQLVRCNPAEGKYMSCMLLYRGNVSPVDIDKSIKIIKSNNSIRFVDWSPTGFKIGINSMPPYHVPHGDIGSTDRAMLSLSNNTTIKSAWCRILVKFRKLFERRAFVHHFTREGLDEGMFTEASEDISALVENYREFEVANSSASL